MKDVLSLVLHVAFLAVIFFQFAAFDVGRHGRVALWWSGGLAVAAVVRMGIWGALEPPGRYGLGSYTELQVMAAIGTAVTCGVGAVALATSRSLRAGPAPWRRWRLGLTVVALAAIPLEIAFGRYGHGTPALWLSWSCLPIAIAFARDGDPGLDHGAPTALALAWIGGSAWLVAVVMSELSMFLFTYDVGDLASPFGWKGPAPRIGWVLFWTTFAVGRWPDARALLVAVPAFLVQLVFWFRIPFATNTAPDLRQRVAEVVDLTGAQVGSRLGQGIPASCLNGRFRGSCSFPHGPGTWSLPPGLSLAQAPVGRWVVYQDAVPERFGYSILDVSGWTVPTSRVLRIREEGGLAIMVGHDAPLPLDVSLMRALKERAPSGRREDHLRVEIEQTLRWTVQDAVSICASASSKDVPAVECAVVAPGAP